MPVKRTGGSHSFRIYAYLSILRNHGWAKTSLTPL